MKQWLLAVMCLICASSVAFGQDFWMPSDSLDKTKFWGLNSVAAVGYTGATIGLSQIWYKDFEKSRFHLFNDMGEWNDLDKAGHLFTAYLEARWTHQAYRWAGVDEKNSIIAGVVIGSLFQATIEVMDGFSDKWGFSLGDIAFNTAGVGLFAGQQIGWGEQRILLKHSTWPTQYPETIITSVDGSQTTTMKARAESLYGTSLPELMIKDYNSLTIWASVNLRSFDKRENSRIPPWLNVAVGYGSQNLYGGFDNTWTDEETGAVFIVPENVAPRYRQIFLSPDIDWRFIPAKRRGWQIFLQLLSWIKLPAPGVEFTTHGKVRLRALAH